MKKIFLSIGLFVIVAVVALGASRFAFAKDGQEDNPDSSTTTSEQQTEQQKKQAEQQAEAAKKAAEQARETAKTLAEQKREAAKQKAEQEHATEVEAEHAEIKGDSDSFLTELRTRVKEHTQEERTKNCEDRKQGLVTKLQNLQKNAAAYQTKVTNVYNAAQAYMTSNNISGTTFDQLLSEADKAQASSKVSVDALLGLSVNIDCSTTTVASQVAAFRAAADKARSSLQEYKAKVQALLKAIREQTGGQS